jgi:hypothetical protein
MRLKLAGNKADSEIHVVRNDDTVTIQRGQPVCLQLTGVADANDGLDVVLPSTASAGAFGYAYGVATKNMAVGEFGEVIAYGLARFALVGVLSRSATSANWPAIVSSAAGGVLQLDTVNNMLQLVAAVAPASNYIPFAIMVDSVAAQASQSSVTSGPGSTQTMSSVGARVFVRML